MVETDTVYTTESERIAIARNRAHEIRLRWLLANVDKEAGIRRKRIRMQAKLVRMRAKLMHLPERTPIPYAQRIAGMLER